MIMARTHLHEFLKEDQEPFQLKNYIADRRSQLKLTEKTTAAVTKRKPVNERNAAVLQKQSSSSSKSKPRPSKNVGFGLLGSFLKRLKHNKSTHTKRHEISCLNNKKSSISTRKFRGKEAENDVVISLDANSGAYRSRVSSSDWSEKSSESETSCSSVLAQESYEIQSLGVVPENHVSSSFATCLCSSPSFGHRTPDFLSPATSPTCRFRQDKENYDVEQNKDINVEDEEQCSPISVLDRPFEDHEHEYDVVGGDAYDLESSYANLQRTKHQLLQKLARFERLVDLDPIALEKHMAEECDDDENDDYQGVVTYVEKEVAAREEFLRGIIGHLGIKKIPLHVERLVLDLILEENKNEEYEAVLKRVCWRLDSWKLVESNTIDMMVEFELRRLKSEGWRRHDHEMVKEIAMSIEVVIMGVLVEEFVEEIIDFFQSQSSR